MTNLIPNSIRGIIVGTWIAGLVCFEKTSASSCTPEQTSPRCSESDDRRSGPRSYAGVRNPGRVQACWDRTDL